MAHYRQELSDRFVSDLFSGAVAPEEFPCMKAKANVIAQMQSDVENELYDIEKNMEE